MTFAKLRKVGYKAEMKNYLYNRIFKHDVSNNKYYTSDFKYYFYTVAGLIRCLKG